MVGPGLPADTTRLLGRTSRHLLAPTLSPAPHPPDQLLRNQPVNLQLLQIWSKPETFSGRQHHHCKHRPGPHWWWAELLKGNVILPWRESGYLHTRATTTINIILECFARTEKYGVIMCAELSREGRWSKQEQNTTPFLSNNLLLIFLTNNTVMQTKIVCENCLKISF